MDVPEIRFATSDGVHIAYQVVGEGPIDVVWIHDWLGNLELQWDLPAYARLLERVASFSRLLLFDKRGSGLSDRTVDPDLFTLEVRVDDVRAVMDATGSREAVVFGHGDDGASLAASFAAIHPERTRGLILYGARALDTSSDDYRLGYDREQAAVWHNEAENFWATEVYARRWLGALAPSVAHDEATVRWYARYLRQAASPGTELMFERTVNDIRPALAAIHVPTLVLHRIGDTDVPVEGGRDVAARVEGARFVELPGVDSYPWAGDQEPLLAEIEGFVSASRPGVSSDRMLATVLFTDIVGSTQRAARIGDAAWTELLRSHDERARREIEAHQGRYVHTTGDGVLAVFDGPARAVRCAGAIQRTVAELSIEIRAGCHAGEVELVRDDVQGIAVHVCARIAAAAGPSEVLVSSTVKDLVAGSGLVFEDAGEHELKGVPDRWHLYRVVG